jgi:Protein of unknown function (DUF2827)
MKKINVVITISTINEEARTNIWTNGGNQHAIFLYECLRLSPLVAQVKLAYSDNEMPNLQAWSLEAMQDDFVPASQAYQAADLVIQFGTQINQDVALQVKARGGKVVSYCFGNAYTLLTESMLFNTYEWATNPYGGHFDQVWTNAQHMHTCKGLFEFVFNAPVIELPHIWMPIFLEKQLDRLNIRDKFGYRNQGIAKKITVFEPNINMVKNCVIPSMVAETTYRKVPELISKIYLTNALGIYQRFAFRQLATHFTSAKTAVLSVEQRMSTPDMLANHTDVVLAHQWENGLNYLYYDVLYGNYPLVHNSPFLKNVGYYYPDFEVKQGANVLEHVLRHHDENLVSYQANSTQFLATVNAVSLDNVQAYSHAIENLFA